jgi:hypothetical protein
MLFDPVRSIGTSQNWIQHPTMSTTRNRPWVAVISASCWYLCLDSTAAFCSLTRHQGMVSSITSPRRLPKLENSQTWPRSLAQEDNLDVMLPLTVAPVVDPSGVVHHLYPRAWARSTLFSNTGATTVVFYTSYGLDPALITSWAAEATAKVTLVESSAMTVTQLQGLGVQQLPWLQVYARPVDRSTPPPWTLDLVASSPLAVAREPWRSRISPLDYTQVQGGLQRAFDAVLDGAAALLPEQRTRNLMTRWRWWGGPVTFTTSQSVYTATSVADWWTHLHTAGAPYVVVLYHGASAGSRHVNQRALYQFQRLAERHNSSRSATYQFVRINVPIVFSNWRGALQLVTLPTVHVYRRHDMAPKSPPELNHDFAAYASWYHDDESTSTATSIECVGVAEITLSYQFTSQVDQLLLESAVPERPCASRAQQVTKQLQRTWLEQGDSSQLRP